MGKKIIRIIFEKLAANERDEEKHILARMTYGGGVINSQQVKELLGEKNIGVVPQSIVVGNISESNVKETFKILETVIEYNEK